MRIIEGKQMIKVELYGVKTGLIKPGDNIVELILNSLKAQRITLENGDILVIAESALSSAQGRVVRLEEVKPSSEALKIAQKYEVAPEIAELILREADKILGGVSKVILTIKDKVFMANAGIDKSNAPPGYVTLLPENPEKVARDIRIKLWERTGKKVGVLIADSRTQPLRLGTVGLCLAASGFEPVIDERGHKDLYGKPLQITRRAVADNLASAAQVIMGEADEGIPVVLIRGAPVKLTDREISSDEMYIPPEECMYTSVFKTLR